MTMPYSASRALYQGNGRAVDFPFAFRVWHAGQLHVSLTSPDDVNSTATGWSVTLHASGGTVHYLHQGAPLPEGWRLAIVRDMPFSQEIDLVPGTLFDPQVIEDGLDQAAAERQQLLERLSRAVVMPPTSQDTPDQLISQVITARNTASAAAQAAGQSVSDAAREAESAHSAAGQAAAHASEARQAADATEEARQLGARVDALDERTDELAGCFDAKGQLVPDCLPTVLAPGLVMPFAGQSTPAGWLLCDGAAVSRTAYAALFAAIGTTYGQGDGRTTFNLPDLTGRFVQGSSTAGTVKAPGLPNVTARHGVMRHTWATAEGAVRLETASINDYAGGSLGGAIVTIDLSRGNSIYGASDTVQPPALTMRYVIKY